MKNIFNKANAPYLVSGALATSALLASGVFTVAPYIGFLAPVAALSLGLPLIVAAAVFSVIAIALSCAAISKNKTISETVKNIEDKDKTISEKEDQLNQKNTEISSLKEQLSNKEDEVKVHKKKISEKEEVGIQAALGKALTSTKEAFISGRVNRIVKDGLKNAYGAIPSARSTREIFSGTCDTSVKYAKDALNSVTSGLKSIYSVTSIFPVLGRSSESTKS